MTLAPADFGAFHEAVHGKPAFTWQIRLLHEIVERRAWPRVLDLPTGAGKTTCLDIALFALALDAGQPTERRWCPRRIAMVVDRRIVVDQVAERGRKLQRALLCATMPTVEHQPGHRALAAVADRLRSLSTAAQDPIGVYTLRGGIPKDDGWARTPDQPLILSSTIDQLGSRLFVQGYGVSRGMRPVHAGLLGNDLLLLLDEVHLSQPFAEALDGLAGLRARFATDKTLPRRFAQVFVSATPGLSTAEPFRLNDDDTAAESPLGRRLRAPKPARLRDVDGRQELEKACVGEARALIGDHDVVAVVVNRVATAAVVVRQLREDLGERADVVLLTGRMRPLDRDDVLARLRGRIMTGRDRGQVEKKLVVVGTQCIEAGADFDFDALVTEAASIDALRQRFGRVDRLGLYGKAEAIILRDNSEKSDPIYGDAIANTYRWLREQLSKKAKTLDFGILALPTPSQESLPGLLAPKPHAPVLLPAYLDLWMQTSPEPVVTPDVSLWLHGPQSGPADVQLVWRADLSEADLLAAISDGADDEDRERPTAIVAAVRPSSLEAISVSLAAARRWLANTGNISDAADVEGQAADKGEVPNVRPALRWAGAESRVIFGNDVRPGDTIVVPAAWGGIRDGSFDPTAKVEVSDLAERAAVFGRGRPTLRLQPEVLRQLGLTASVPAEDLQEVRSSLASFANDQAPHDWRKPWAHGLARSKGALVVEGRDGPWTVLVGGRLPPNTLRSLLLPETTLEDGVELTTDEDDSFQAGRAVTLSQHSGDVERFAREFARAVGLPPNLIEDLALAGWLHDIGKADRRFQLMLREGSEIAFYKDETVWAKSLMPAGARVAQRLAQRRSHYPQGARHEVQSVAMIERHRDVVQQKADDLDLVLHLVASHHGYCRPFAPVAVDTTPVAVTLRDHHSDAFGVIDFGPTTSDHGLHRLESPLADRFWRLVERYGWLELCWLEAILRLADHRASEEEQEGEG